MAALSQASLADNIQIEKGSLTCWGRKFSIGELRQVRLIGDRLFLLSKLEEGTTVQFNLPLTVEEISEFALQLFLTWGKSHSAPLSLPIKECAFFFTPTVRQWTHLFNFNPRSSPFARSKILPLLLTNLFFSAQFCEKSENETYFREQEEEAVQFIKESRLDDGELGKEILRIEHILEKLGWRLEEKYSLLTKINAPTAGSVFRQLNCPELSGESPRKPLPASPPLPSFSLAQEGVVDHLPERITKHFQEAIADNERGFSSQEIPEKISPFLDCLKNLSKPEASLENIGELSQLARKLQETLPEEDQTLLGHLLNNVFLVESKYSPLFSQVWEKMEADLQQRGKIKKILSGNTAAPQLEEKKETYLETQRSPKKP